MSGAARNPWIVKAPILGIASNPAGAEQQLPPLPGGGEAPAAANPRLSLFCFTPAGSGACVYHGWEHHLPEVVEVLPVELPGRNSRMREAPVTSMQQLVESLLPALLPLLEQRPFAFFGHSMGAWVAYALTQELRRRGGPLPLKLYASANRSPLLAGPEHDVDPTVMHLLPPESFWEALAARYGPNPSLEHAGIRKLLLPMLTADFRVIETWQPGAAASGAAAEAVGAAEQPSQEQQGEVQLPCPIAALGATEDGRYTRQQLQAWRHCAAPGAFEERWFDGGHFYATTDGPGRRQLLQWLAADLPQLLQAPPVGSEAEEVKEVQDSSSKQQQQASLPAQVPPQQQVAAREAGPAQALPATAPHHGQCVMMVICCW